MADFTALKTAIQTYIKQNGNEEITGEKLQEILLSMVTTLGDSAINDLITALNDEVAARQNADGTLQQNITNEATVRGNADTALDGRIDDEATARDNGDTALANRLGSTITAENTAADQIGAEAEARAAADTALQDLIDGITENIENGYVYAGIATPSSTPATGKVFYLALTAGTYTNFGSTVVSQGINILKYNGSAWSLDAFIGIDDELTPSSNKLPKSGNVLENIIKNGSAFDLSAYNAVDGVLATYADLSAALTALNGLPAVYKQGGMSFRFVCTSDNNYVQYRLMSDSFNTTVANWQGIDDEPTAGSDNLVKSGLLANFRSFLSYLNRTELQLLSEFTYSLLSHGGQFRYIISQENAIQVNKGDKISVLFDYKCSNSQSTDVFTIRLYEADENGNILHRINVDVSAGLYVHTISDNNVRQFFAAFFSYNDNVGNNIGYCAGYMFKGEVQLNNLFINGINNRVVNLESLCYGYGKLINTGSIELNAMTYVIGKYYNRGDGAQDATFRAYVNEWIDVYKGRKYILKQSSSAKILICFYNSNKQYVSDITGWFNSTEKEFTPTDNGYIRFSIETENRSDMTQEYINSLVGSIGYNSLQDDLNAIKTEVASNESNINANSRRLSALESSIITNSTRLSALESPSTHATPYIQQEVDLKQKLNSARLFNKPVFAICTDDHCAPVSNPYGTITVAKMLEHADIIAKLSNIMGVDWLGNLGDAVSGEKYSLVQDVLDDMDAFITRLRQAKAPLIYSIAHHELYFNGSQSYEAGATKQQIWAIGGNSRTYLDYVKHYGSEVFDDVSASMYYYFDNPITKLRVINLCTVDGSSSMIGYNQLVWVRDYALANVPNGYGVIVIGHVPISAKLQGYDGTITGFSTFNSIYDKASNGLTLDIILNNAISNGVNVIAYVTGHAHRDNVWTLEDSKYPNIITCCDVPVKYNSSQTGQLGNAESYDRTVGTLSEYCMDFFAVDVNEAICKIFRFGCGYDRVVYCRNKTLSVGNTLDLTSIIGTDLSYTSSDSSVATIASGVVTGVAQGQAQIIAYDSVNNTKHFITVVVSA